MLAALKFVMVFFSTYQSNPRAKRGGDANAKLDNFTTTILSL